MQRRHLSNDRKTENKQNISESLWNSATALPAVLVLSDWVGEIYNEMFSCLANTMQSVHEWLRYSRNVILCCIVWHQLNSEMWHVLKYQWRIICNVWKLLRITITITLAIVAGVKAPKLYYEPLPLLIFCSHVFQIQFNFIFVGIS